jgi:hypothetical protein
MDSKDLALLLTEELESRSWTVLRLAAEANIPYETARRAVRGSGSISLNNTHKLLVALGKELKPQIAVQKGEVLPPTTKAEVAA